MARRWTGALAVLLSLALPRPLVLAAEANGDGQASAPAGDLPSQVQSDLDALDAKVKGLRERVAGHQDATRTLDDLAGKLSELRDAAKEAGANPSPQQREFLQTVHDGAQGLASTLDSLASGASQAAPEAAANAPTQSAQGAGGSGVQSPAPPSQPVANAPELPLLPQLPPSDSACPNVYGLNPYAAQALPLYGGYYGGSPYDWRAGPFTTFGPNVGALPWNGVPWGGPWPRAWIGGGLGPRPYLPDSDEQLEPF